MDLYDLMQPGPIYAEIAHGKIALRSDFVHSEKISEIPGSRFHGKGQDYWSVPLSWTSAVCLTNTFGDSLLVGENLTQWLNDHWTNVIEPVNKLRSGDGELIITDEILQQFHDMVPANRSPLVPVNRRYQVAGAVLLATAKRFILADEQGTGKMTQVAMALFAYPDTLPALIVAPGSTLYSWQRELAVFGLDSVILDGSAAQRRKAIEKVAEDGGPRIVITSYGMLAKHSRVAPYGNIKLTEDHKTPKELNGIEWRTVVADEVHRAKSPKTVQTRALWGVSSNAEYRWATTGTPVEQSPMDFWALLHFIDPEGWPSSVKMRDRWVDHYTNFFGGIEILGIRSDRLSEWQQVTEHLWRRKLKQGLPPREEEYRYCELKGKHLKAYKDMEKQLMAEVGDDDDLSVLFAPNHMVKAGRLLQLANSYIEVETEFDDDGEEVISVTPIEPSPKLDLMMETLEDLEGTPTIFWFSSVKFMRMAQERLDAKGYPYVVIDGSMSSKRRDESVVAFQDGSVDIILISVAAGSEGTTLTRAPVAVYVQRPHSSIMNDQSEDRNHRIGSEIHDKITIINLVTQGTIEEEQHEQRARKRQIRDEVISPFAVS